MLLCSCVNQSVYRFGKIALYLGKSTQNVLINTPGVFKSLVQVQEPFTKWCWLDSLANGQQQHKELMCNFTSQLKRKLASLIIDTSIRNLNTLIAKVIHGQFRFLWPRILRLCSFIIMHYKVKANQWGEASSIVPTHPIPCTRSQSAPLAGTSSRSSCLQFNHLAHAFIHSVL